MSHDDRHETFQPVAGLLACLFPGLGHWYLDSFRRGGLICLGVMGLFLAGMLIGGIDVVDRRQDKWWFVLQAGVGPSAFAVDWWHDRHRAPPGYTGDAATPGGAPSGPLVVTSLGHVNEIGSLYTGMAGLLNLIAVIDAFWHAERGRRRRRVDPAPPTITIPQTGGGA